MPVGIAFDRHQRNLAVVVDLGEARQLRARQLAHGAEEAHARIFRVERGDQVGQRGFVLRPDRPDQQLAAVPVDMLLEFLGVGADGEAAEAEAAAAAFDMDAALARHHAAGFDMDRVEFDGGDLVDVGEQLRQTQQGVASSVSSASRSASDASRASRRGSPGPSPGGDSAAAGPPRCAARRRRIRRGRSPGRTPHRRQRPGAGAAGRCARRSDAAGSR
jgi:hypothetical protein